MSTPAKEEKAAVSSAVDASGVGEGPSLDQAESFLHRGMLVSFRNVSYTVRNSANKKEELTLLSSVSGYLRPGELVALMGPSGSGKTTLMDILARRKTVGTIEGEILFGGQKPTRRFMRRFTGYVEQQDTLVPILTVQEMLMYTAELKLEESTSKEEKERAVDRVVDTLALDSCRDTLIGSPMRRGISGGQSKRVNIGIALITNPRVLFLDEPTTGLDSFTANEVMTAVKAMATGGITVCATIHSPTSYCFSLFDRLMLLLRGRTVYFGRNGQTAVEYLHDTATDIATTVQFNKYSPADWITDITVVSDREQHHERLAQSYAASEAHSHVESELDVQLKDASKKLSRQNSEALAVKRATTTSTMHAVNVLIRYRMMRNYRSFEFYASRAMPWVFLSLILMSVFWDVGSDINAANAINVLAILFYFGIVPAFTASSFVPAIMLSRPLYFRERNDGVYRPITFLMYLMSEEVLIGIPVTLVVATMVWFGCSLQGSWLIWWVSFIISFVTGIASAYFIAAMCPSMDVANAAVPIYGVLCMFFSGFLIRVPDIGWWWRWYVYLTPTYYAVSAQFANFFEGDRNVVIFGNQTVTEYYDVEYLPKWGFVGMQLIFPVFFSVCAWAALAYKTNVKR